MNNINIWDKRFIISITQNEFNNLIHKIVKSDVSYIEIDWKKIKTESDLYKIFSEKIKFPDYFWNNWNAFWDIMTDNYFINKDIIISITNIDNLLSEDNESNKIFLKDLIYLLSTKFIDVKIQVFIIE